MPTLSCCTTPGSYCARTDALVGLEGVHVIEVNRAPDRLTFTVETPWQLQGCGACGVVAPSHGRRTGILRDIPCAGMPVVLAWRQRTNPHRAKIKGPTMLTGMVDLTRDAQGRTRARLLDLVPGRTGKVFGDWLTGRGPEFCQGIKVATLDPFRGYANAIDEHLDEAAPVLDAFHVVKLGATALDEVRRRVQQTTLGHRGRAGDRSFGSATFCAEASSI